MPSVKEVKPIQRVLDLLYPRHCFVCGGIAPVGKNLCEECIPRIPVITTRRCGICGKPVERTEVVCDDCGRNHHDYDEGYGLLLYDETMRSAMSYLKYKGRREYGSVFGQLLYEGAKAKIELWKPDLLLPIPIHKKRRRERGYNQAEEIAKTLSEAAGIPMMTDVLIRKEETLAMKKLDAGERKENLKHAFLCTKQFRPGSRILIVDDIYTTGATIDGASRVLKASGCGRVFFLSVCIGGGFMVRY